MGQPAWAGWWSAGVCVLAAALLAAFHLALVRTLREPAPDPDDPYLKPPYRSLVTPRFALVSVTLAASAGFVASFSGGLRPALVVWAGLATSIVVDAATTYLPAALHWWGVAEMVIALIIIAAVFGDWWSVLWRATTGAALIGGMFWLLWWLPQRLGRGSPLGYGDVRLMALFGVVAGVGGATYAYLAVLLGTLGGALYGVVVSLWRRRHPSPLGTMFAYGPGLWAGPVLAVAALMW